MTIAKKVLLTIAREFYAAALEPATETVQDTYHDAADALMDVLDMWNEEGE